MSEKKVSTSQKAISVNQGKTNFYQKMSSIGTFELSYVYDALESLKIHITGIQKNVKNALDEMDTIYEESVDEDIAPKKKLKQNRHT